MEMAGTVRSLPPSPHRRGPKPRLDGEPAKHRIGVRLTPSQRLAIEKFAALTGGNITDIIRDAVTTYIEDCSE